MQSNWSKYMDSMYRTVFAIFCPILALLLHELTHIAIAKYQGMTSMNLVSVFPQFRIEISYPDTQSDRGMQLMAIAPFVVGVISALIIISSGLWRQIQLSIPYYIEGIFILSWVAYCHLSPADVRTILNPGRSTPTP
jgi:prepilin signal peptidase PulO-like enzyme (type II secretory pathway)